MAANTNTEPLLLAAEVKASSSRYLPAAATLGATLLGSGVLAQPEACENLGIVLFLVLSGLAATLSHCTAMMLCKTSCFLIQQQQQQQQQQQGEEAAAYTALADEDAEEEAEPAPILTYAEVASRVFGWRGRVLTMLAVIVMQIGCCVAYVVVMGDIFGPLARHWMGTDSVTRQHVVAVVAVVVLLPLTVFVRRMSSFKYTSAFTVLAVVLCATLIIGNSVVYVLLADDPDQSRRQLIGNEEAELHGPFALPQHPFLMLKSFTIVSFAYFMHFNVMPVLHTVMEENADQALVTYSKASRVSFAVAACCTSGVGVFGYATFVNFTQSDVLLNFQVTSQTFNIVKLLYGVGLSFAFPIVIWEARENLKLLVVQDKPTRELFSVHAGLSVVLVVLTCVIGSLITDLSVVFGFVGSTCTPIIAYILPSAVYLRSGAAKHHDDERTPRLAFAVGLAVIPFGLTMWVLDLLRSDS